MLNKVLLKIQTGEDIFMLKLKDNRIYKKDQQRTIELISDYFNQSCDAFDQIKELIERRDLKIDARATIKLNNEYKLNFYEL